MHVEPHAAFNLREKGAFRAGLRPRFMDMRAISATGIDSIGVDRLL